MIKNKAVKHCILALSVYKENDSPVFGETSTHVTLDDEGGGCFFTIKQDSGTLRFDFDEFEEVVKAVNVLKQVDKGLIK